MPKAKKGTVNLDPELDVKLKAFKRIFDIILEEDISYNDYVNTVISIGIDAMIRTVVPEGTEWNMIQNAFDKRFDVMCDLVAEVWDKDVKDEKEFKRRIRRGIEGYIH